MNRVCQLILMLSSVLSVSCQRENENNKNNRNENWCWWVDDDSGKGMWIPVKNNSTVENGKYTLFYFNGGVYEKGTMKKRENVDTTFYFDLLGVCYGYKLNLSDTDRIYYYKDGNYKIYYSSGQLNCSGIVTDHHQGDQWKVFYKSGKLSSYKNLTNGIGYITDYFKNGRKKAVIYSDRLLQEDLYVEKWYENGQPAFTSEWMNGRYDGVLKKYYENGQLEKIWGMKNGIHEGISKEYYESGQLKKIWEMKNGLQEGVSTGYYKNGEISEKLQVNNGLKQGPATLWYENGQVKAMGYFRNGKMDGPQKAFYENGVLLCEATMKDGKPEGMTRRYDSLGKITSIELYSNGRRVK